MIRTTIPSPSTTPATITLAKAPPPRFLLQHPAHLIACGFGSGLAPKAPGTFGTLFALASFPLLRWAMDDMQLLIFLAAAYALGIWAIAITGKALGEPDHGSIVWDEIVPFWFVLLLTPAGWLWWLTAFALFRFFDIVKLPPAGWFDRNMKTGFGVMADDACAAVHTLIVLAVIKWILG